MYCTWTGEWQRLGVLCRWTAQWVRMCGSLRARVEVRGRQEQQLPLPGSAQHPAPCLCPQPCLQYWPEPGRQQYGLMDVEFVSGSVDEDLVARVFRVQNISRVSDLGALW